MKKKYRSSKPFLTTLLLIIIFINSGFNSLWATTPMFPTAAQQTTVTGVVSDENGNPLPGAAVVEGGTTNGTVTDFDGNYSITVSSSDAVLQFSYIGYNVATETVDNRSSINISLEPDNQALEEVVVIGFGTQQKQDVTGALSTIDGEQLTIAPTPNLGANLAGRLPGVVAFQTSGQPGFDDPTFQIRGRTSTNNNDPLVLIDGVERPFNRVNPYEIESQTVLKDAASTAVYGSRAANGVLLITTKRGRQGKPTFNMSTRYGLSSPTGRPDLMSASQYVLAFREALSNRGTAEADLPFPELVASAEAGSVESFDWWEATLGNTATDQQYNFSVDGGSEKIQYFFAYGHLNQTTFFDLGSYKQNSIRANIDADIADGLTFSLNVAGRLEDRLRSADGDGEIYSNALRANPLLPVFVNGRPNSEGLPPNSLGFDGFSGNSYGDANRNGANSRDDDFFQTNFQVDYDIPGIEGLSARAMYSYDREVDRQSIFFTPYISYQTNEATGELIPNASDNIRFLEENRGDSQQQTTQLSLRYNRQFGNHEIGGLLLYEEIDQKFNNIFARRDGFISDAIQDLFAGSIENDENFGLSSETARRGYVGRLDYNFKNRYLFQANLRVDESYIFPENSRRGVFPAFSAGWRISEENFLKDSDLITDLKFRGSWGQTGNDAIRPFQFQTGFNFVNGYVRDGVLLQGLRPSGVANPDITWETSTTTDLGIEADLWNGKLTLEADYFYTKTEDILAARSLAVPLTFGAILPDENLGETRSSGWELSLTHKNTIGSDFYYKLNANLTLLDNEILFIDEPAEVLPSIRRTGGLIIDPGDRFIGFLSDGLYQNEAEIAAGPDQSGLGEVSPGDIRYVDLNGRDVDGNLTGQPDGVINQDDRTIIGGNDVPLTIFGFNTEFDFKGINLNLNFVARQDFSREIQPTGFLLDVGNNFEVLTDSWTPDNPDAKYPRILPNGNANNNQNSDFWIEDIWFIRLNNAQLSYDLMRATPKLEDLGLQRLEVALSANNLFTLTNISLGDPSGNAENALFYPLQRTISLGFNIGF